MIFLIIILAISLNIDSFGAGISYGIRNIKIPAISKLALCFISILYSSVAILIGEWLVKILPIKYVNLFGVIILIGMGLWIILQNVFLDKSKNSQDTYVEYRNKQDRNSMKKIIDVYIKPLKLTIQITKDPTLSDTDNSKIIELKEAILLGSALSIDAIGASIGSCAAGFSSVLLPPTIGLCQLLFLSLGNVLGRKLMKFNSVNKKVCFVTSGLLLIFLGIIRLF
jgi:putative sporulation protein YtaF